MGWRRRVRVLLVILGILAAVGVGSWWALPQFWSPPDAPGIGAVGTDAPLDDLFAGPATPSGGEERPSADPTVDGTDKQAPGLGLTRERGRLALQIDGERMGEEVYELSRRPDGGVELVSRGRFSLKVWFATVSFNYTQRVHMTDNLQPDRYRLDLNGPLGLGNRHIQAAVSERRARINTGSATQTVSLPEGPVAFIGVLASYAFTPKLIADRSRQSVTAVVFDVRDPDPAPGEAVPTVPLEITRRGSARLSGVDGGPSMETARYRLALADEPESELIMYARDGTFLGLKGRFRADEPPFRIYRADRLPGGFSVSPRP
jgi:hypothetical protein